VSHEILYTSAPQGLKPGSRGFCTVVSTAGIAKNLAERLESFSGYRHAFMAHEAQADQNPVNYAHYHTTVGGRKYHVLSRIADAGLDYTQRSNKLAHHVALEPDEVGNAPGGPAWVMAAEGFFVKQWDGQVRTLPAGRRPTGSDRPAQLCQSWKGLTGDAGWGGVLAESALRKGGVMSVIFPAGTPVLDLVLESLGLLPPEKRWEVTFSTYFTKAPAGVDCQWRFLLDGTPEATALRRDVRAAVIDLCKPLGQAQGGDLVQAARARPVSKRGPSRSEAPLQRSMPDVPRPVATTAQPRAEESGELSLAPPTPPSPARRSIPPPAWLPSAAPRRSRRWLLPTIVAGLLLIVLGAVLGVVLSRPRDVPPVQVASPQPTPPPKPEPSKPPDAPAPPEQTPPNKTTEQTPESRLSAERPADEPKVFVSGKRLSKRRPSPFQAIHRLSNKLRLPPFITKNGQALDNKPNTEQHVLAKLYVPNACDCELRLLGREFDPRDGQESRIVVRDENGVRYWEVLAERKTALNEQITPIATFALDNQELRFNWHPKRPLQEPEPPLVRFALCSLEITAYDKIETCEFETDEFEPRQIPSLRLSEPGSRITLVNGGQFPLRPDDDVVVDLEVGGIDKVIFPDPHQLKLRSGSRSTMLWIPVDPSCPNASDTKIYFMLDLDDLGRAGEMSIKSRLVVEGSRPTRAKPPEKKRVELGPAQPNWKKEKFPATELTDKMIGEHREASESNRKSFMIVHKDQAWLREWSNKSRVERIASVESWRKQTQNQPFFGPQVATDGGSNKTGTVPPKQETKEGPLENQAPTMPQDWRRLIESVRLAEEYNLLADFVDWCDAMQELKNNFVEKASLDYRLYLKVEDQEIELVVTKEFGEASSGKRKPK